MANREEARAQIANLVADFKARIQARARFNERQTGASFIEPLFEALGWAVRNPEEVPVEFTVARERADYTFRLGGVTKFIVEAKAPRLDLNNLEFKKQAVTYAYNKGVNWAVLTNFRELRVFNAENDREFLSLNAESYLDNFDNLWLLSKEAFTTGTFQQRAQAFGAMQPLIPVEKYLFDQLRAWRGELFNQIHHHNPSFTMPQIDELIQTLFNRLIFIRTAEDRGIEDNRLRAALHQWISNRRQGEFIERLRSIFADFERDYDSDLFPKMMDRWSSVFVEGPTLETIIGGLYDRPGKMAGYDFSAIDADVLGAVYEQYLGYVGEVVKERVRQAEKQLRLLGAGEDLSYELTAKKQKRKAQGIYYTPKWVVDYIVRQTVGRFLEERSHDEILNMKILDPACGSGSFLIRAYDELLRYHARIRGKTPAELEWQDRLPILTRNIFGVDLDDQAVQIARLNLLLRALARRETLPSLKDNIRRGNSLISGGEEELKPYFGDAWRDKHPFNWGEQFPDIMAQGGFDVVIGNPPYVRFGSLPANEKSFYKDAFAAAFRQYDIYVLFIEKGIRLLKPGGRLGFIVSSKFFASDYGERLRKLILDTCAIESVVNVSELPVFKEASVYPYIVTLREVANEDERVGNLIDVVRELQAEDDFLLNNYSIYRLPQARFSEPPHILDMTSSAPDIIEHVKYVGVPLSSICKVTRGFRPPPSNLIITEQDFSKLDEEERRNYRKMLDGKDIKGPYAASWKGVYLKYNASQIPEAKPAQVFESPKIMISDISYRSKAYFDREGFYCLKTIYLILLKEQVDYDLRYITGIINSKLCDFFFRSRFSAMHMRGSYLRFRKQFLDLIPIRRIDFDNPTDKEMHDRLVALVERMLELHKRKPALSSAEGADNSLPQSELEDIQREIARTDREIDNLVYDLYGLTAEEIQIVEEATGETRRGMREL